MRGKQFLESRLRKKVEHTLEESQMSSEKKKRGTGDQTVIVRQLYEKATKVGSKYMHILWTWRRHSIVCQGRACWREWSRTTAYWKHKKPIWKHVIYISVRNKTLKTFAHKTGLRHGCILSPLIQPGAGWHSQKGKESMCKYRIGYWNMKIVKITELCYTDNLKQL